MTDKRRREWCDWHIACRDYKGWACAAHLNEAHVFECQYEGPAEAEENCCQDFRASKTSRRGGKA